MSIAHVVVPFDLQPELIYYVAYAELERPFLTDTTERNGRIGPE